RVAGVDAPAALLPARRPVAPGDGRPRVRPEVPVGVGGAGRHRVLEPGMVTGRVVDDEIHDDRNPAIVGGCHQVGEVLGGAVVGLDRPIVGHVVAVIAGGL